MSEPVQGPNNSVQNPSKTANEPTQAALVASPCEKYPHFDCGCDLDDGAPAATIARPEPYYDADGITLWHGDCLDQTAWLAADVLVTDPPYGIAWTKGLNRAAGSRAHAGIKNDHDTTARDAVLSMAAHMPAVVFGSFAAPFPTRVKQTLVWQKPNDAGVVGSVTGFRRDIEAVFLVGDWPMRTVMSSSVLRSGARMVGGMQSPAGRTGHPHSKPLDLMEQLIAACPPGVVADPFAGSGSTLLAARAQGRRAIGVEIDEAYCEVIASRLAQGDLFGETA